MTFIDKYLQYVRIQKALRHIPQGAVLLDIGCSNGELLLKASGKISAGTGIDPNCADSILSVKLRLVKGFFPGVFTLLSPVDCITALAVFEHIPANEQTAFFNACYQFLKPSGILILTIPDKKVDDILAYLQKLKLVDGMSFEEHHGYDASDTIPLAVRAGFSLHLHHTFQLKLNNLFVFIKPS